MMQPVVIYGREFAVEPVELSAELVARGRRVYMLTGRRGAQYAAMQYIDAPDMFHVIQAHLGGGEPFPGVVLTDRGGQLEVRS